MRSSEELLAGIRRREATLRIRRQRQGIGELSALSMLLTVALALCFTTVRGAAPTSTAQTGYGSILLGEGAGGYVLAGVLAFMAGVIITVLCIRWRRKQNKIQDKQTKEDEER